MKRLKAQAATAFSYLYHTYLFLAVVGPLCLVTYLSIDRFAYACRPAAPEGDCETTKTLHGYVRRLDVKDTWILARLQATCVLPGEDGRLILHDVKFSVHNVISRFNRIELPARQLRICEVI